MNLISNIHYLYERMDYRVHIYCTSRVMNYYSWRFKLLFSIVITLLLSWKSTCCRNGIALEAKRVHWNCCYCCYYNYHEILSHSRTKVINHQKRLVQLLVLFSRQTMRHWHRRWAGVEAGWHEHFMGIALAPYVFRKSRKHS